jgi:hypothetical protein
MSEEQENMGNDMNIPNEEIQQITGTFTEVKSYGWSRQGTNDYSHEQTDIEQIIDRNIQNVEAVWSDGWVEVSPGIETSIDAHQHRHVRIHRSACPVRIQFRNWYEYVSYDYAEHCSSWSREYILRFECNENTIQT